MEDVIRDDKKFRICYVCRKTLELNEANFYKNKTKKEGFEYCCKSCSKYRLSKYNPKEKTEIEKKEYNNYRNEWRKKRVENGLCRACKEKHIPNQKVCEKHYFQEMSRRHTGTTKNWELLKTMLLNQNKKCFYSGEDIIIGTNDSLDHIKPLSKNPELKNKLDNLCWTTKTINLMKSNLSKEEFLSVIKNIFHYNF